MIKKLLFTLFLVLFQTAVFALNTYTGPNNGDWNTASNWSLGIPTTSDDVVIPAGKTVTISSNSVAKSVSISGTLKINDGLILTVYNNFTVNSGGSFLMPTGSALATLVVYGDYINNGLTDFWKSNVVIAGDLLSPTTSTLQKQGNVVVGGDIIGVFDTTGGNGDGQIYAVNPNATVTITPSTIDNVVVPGTAVTTSVETQALVDLVNLIIYGGSCTFAVNDIANQSVCSGSNVVFSVITNVGSPVYQWQVKTGILGWSDLSNDSTYSGVTTATLTISNVLVGMNGYEYRAKISAGSPACTRSGNGAVLTVNSLPVTPTITVGSSATFCTGGSVTLTSSAASGNQWYNGGVLISGATSTTYSATTSGTYTVITNNGTCSSLPSAGTTVTVNALPATPTITVGGSTTFCAGGNVTLSSSAASGNQWYNGGVLISGATSTTYSATASGTYTVITNNGTCSSLPSAGTAVTVNALPATSTITAGTPTTFCAGGSVTLSSSAASGNQWYNGGVLISGATNATYSATTSGTYTVITNNGTCSSLPSAGTAVTVNALPATPTITAGTPTTFCAGGSVTLSSSAASGNQWYNGGVLISGATNATYSATTSGTYTVITNNGTCSSLPSAGTVVTVNALPITPVVSGATQATCITNGSFTITNYNAAYTYTVTPSTGVVQSGATITAPANSYTVTATDGTCYSSASSSIIIASSSTTTWDGSSWDNGVPTLSDVVIINGTYDNNASNPNIVACSLTINSGGRLIIDDTKFVTIQNHLTVNTGGVLEIKNQGSLVMVSDAGTVTNNGTINVNKTTAEFEKYDYTYWSSPLSGSTSIATTFPSWRRPYEYHPENFIDLNADGFDDNGDDWKKVSTMTRGRGYIIMGPTTGSFPRTESVVFSGAVNNGVVPVPVLLSPGATGNQAGFNLIGNPYPSAISAEEFILANIYGGTGINQTLSGTLYFWTHKDNASVTNPGPEAYNYTVDDYAMYNLSGGIGTGVGTASDSGSDTPSGYIGSGQGFFAGVAAAGTVTFNNSMRVGNLPNTQFFKTQSVKAKSKAIEKDRFWLNLQNADGMFSQQLVGYFENATMGYDNGYDGSLTDAGNFVNFYSFIDDVAYKIQGREAFNADDQVRLGYFSSVVGTFNINIDSKEGVFNASETPIYLEDKALGIIHDLKEGAYSFETEIGNFNDRFVLRYKSTDKTLGTDESKITDNKFIVSVKERQLKVNSYEDLIDRVWVYDLLGRQIFTKEKVNSNEFVISNLVSAKQTLIVKVLLQNGQTYSNKVVY